MGGIVSSVEPGSIADDLGLRVGDEIVAINGHELRDVLDYRFYIAEQFVSVVVKRGNEASQFDIEKDADDLLGVEFTDILFDGLRTCGAKCIFCFVDQLPNGLRKSLYLKDDDYRLSFLDGNFITLANVHDGDLARIIEQRLSPLYVSVHTTDIGLRTRLLGREAPDILAQIDALAKGRITLHTQIVLCRGLNDGEILERTIDDLASRFPAVASIAVVPAGVGRHRNNPAVIAPIDSEYASVILDTIQHRQRRFLAEHGTRLVWVADEFYLCAGRPVPGASTYEGFPQFENGVGLVRVFLDRAYRTRRLAQGIESEDLHVTIVTGTLAYPLLRDWACRICSETLRVRVSPVVNRLFGESVTVAGLLAGQDVIDQLRGKELGDVLLVPSVTVRDGAFLDDVTVEDIAAHLNIVVLVVPPDPVAVIRTLRDYRQMSRANVFGIN